MYVCYEVSHMRLKLPYYSGFDSPKHFHADTGVAKDHEHELAERHKKITWGSSGPLGRVVVSRLGFVGETPIKIEFLHRLRWCQCIYEILVNKLTNINLYFRRIRNVLVLA